MSRAFAYLAFSTLSVSLLVACEPPDEPGTEADTETGDGDGDPTGDGDGDPTGDGDGDPTGDGDGEPAPDADEDGVADDSDNCPDLANPNQLDFDGNGAGNVCDTQVFTTLSGTLASSMFADGNDLGECTLALGFEVTGGEIEIQLDDDAAVAAIEIVNLEFADIPGQDCVEIVVVEPSLSVFEITMTNNGGAFPVSVPHSPTDHDEGAILGDTSAAHPVLTAFTVRSNPKDGLAGDNPYSVPGELPIFNVTVTGAGDKAALSWDAPDHLLATGMFTTEGGLIAEVEFELRGVVGSIDMKP